VLNRGSILSLLLAALAVMGSPGPATISIAAVGSTFGIVRALPYLVGLITGTTGVLIIVALGLSAALLALPALGPALTVASIAYVVYLAWKIASAPPLTARDPASTPPPLWGGVMLGIANPRAYVAIAAVFAANRVAADPATDAIGKTVVLAAMIVVIHIVWLAAGTVFALLLTNPLAARIANAGMATAMLTASLLALLSHHG
jgi:threonine/homoserine/homoserine lactone efflux protein